MYITLIKYIYIYIFLQIFFVFILSPREIQIKNLIFQNRITENYSSKKPLSKYPPLERYYLTNPEIARKKPSQKNVLASLIEPHQLLKSIRRHGTLVKTFIKGFDARKSLGSLKRLSIKGTGEGYKKKKLQGRI